MKKMIIASLMMIFILMPQAYADDMTIVEGIVYQEGTWNPIADARADIMCENGESGSDDTSAVGFYYIEIDCPVNSDLTITVTKGEITKTVGTYVSETDPQDQVWVDVPMVIANIPLGIPEFGTALLPVMMSIVSFGLIKKKF